MSRLISDLGIATTVLVSAVLASTCAWSQHTNTRDCESSTVDDAFTPDAAARARAFLGELKGKVKADDEARVADMIFYPLRVYRGADTQLIKDRAKFLAAYSSILTSHVKTTIEEQSTECLFGNGQGAMVGRGEVWFQEQSNGRYKIVSFNVGPAPSDDDRNKHR